MFLPRPFTTASIVFTLSTSTAHAELIPVELTTLTLNSLTLFAAMTELTGTSDLHLPGANVLLDPLVKIGLIGDTDAIGAHMAMSIFMTAGNAPDTLTSTIEINDKGHISANGQRLK